jgi:putative toxin-antitoxin system antitoxin component (TIGR02293 family)
MTTYDVAEMLGGGQVFVGRLIRSDLDLVDAVRDGMPMAAVASLIRKSALSGDEVERLVFGEGGGAGRMMIGKLTPDESDRLARVARITALATETFREPGRAATWLRTPNRALGGAVPIALLASGEGGRMVEETLIQLAHGIFA